jgi:hypothetical protein
MEDVDDVRVSGNYPRVQKRVPMHGILGPEPLVKRVRVGQDLRVEQTVKAEDLLRLAGADTVVRSYRHT